jgi:hypothetical protein
MARLAGALLDRGEPLLLALHRPAREFVRRRHLEEREPVHRRIDLRGFSRRCGVARDEIERASRRHRALARIDEAVAAHPDVVHAFRKVGNDVAALLVGDDDLGVLRRQLVRLGDDPHAGFGALRAGDDAHDVVAFGDR